MNRKLPQLRDSLLGADIAYGLPDGPTDAHAPTLEAIRRAWALGVRVDTFGQLWIARSRLHIIIRTSKVVAREVAAAVPDRDRQRELEDMWVRGWHVQARLDREIQREGRLSRADYLRFSEAHYRGIRDASEIQLLRVRRAQRQEEFLRKLKKERMKRFGVGSDELTGEHLRRDAEFAHVLSKTAYPEYSDCVWNGVIVNKEVHIRLTAAGLVNDDELLAWCERHAMRTDWFPDFDAGYRQASDATGI